MNIIQKETTFFLLCMFFPLFRNIILDIIVLKICYERAYKYMYDLFFSYTSIFCVLTAT